MKKSFVINDIYKGEIKKIAYIDALLAVLLFIGYCVALIVCGIVDKFTLI